MLNSVHVTIMLVKMSLCIALFISDFASIDDAHIITRFSGIEVYALKVFEMKNFQWKAFGGHQSPNQFQHDYCEKIRTARIFEIADTNTAARKGFYLPTMYSLKKSEVKSENKKLIRSFGRKRISIKNIKFETKFQMWSFTCLAANGNYGLAVVHDEELSSGFMFEKTFLYGVRSKNFMALVDDKTTHYNTPQINLQQDFLNFKKTATNESLCYLPANLQFRLCSLCADELHRTINPTRVMKESNEADDNIIYNDPFCNYYYPQNNFNETCPEITVNMKESSSNVTHQAVVAANLLYCYVSIREIEYRFYISRARNNQNLHTSQIFIVMKEDETGQFIIKYDMFVPLLKKIDKLNEIWNIIESETKTVPTSKEKEAWIPRSMQGCCLITDYDSD